MTEIFLSGQKILKSEFHSSFKLHLSLYKIFYFINIDSTSILFLLRIFFQLIFIFKISKEQYIYQIYCFLIGNLFGYVFIMLYIVRMFKHKNVE